MSSSDCGVLLEGGVVDQHVEPAERRDRLATTFSQNFASLTSPATSRQRRPSASMQRLRLLGVVVLVEVGDGDVGAFAREQHRDGAADAGVAAGDDRREAFELAAAAVVGRQEPRRELEVGLAAGLAAGAAPAASRAARARRPAPAFSCRRSSSPCPPDRADPARPGCDAAGAPSTPPPSCRPTACRCRSADACSSLRRRGEVSWARELCAHGSISIVKVARRGNGCARAATTAALPLPDRRSRRHADRGSRDRHNARDERAAPPRRHDDVLEPDRRRRPPLPADQARLAGRRSRLAPHDRGAAAATPSPAAAPPAFAARCPAAAATACRCAAARSRGCCARSRPT